MFNLTEGIFMTLLLIGFSLGIEIPKCKTLSKHCKTCHTSQTIIKIQKDKSDGNYYLCNSGNNCSDGMVLNNECKCINSTICPHIKGETGHFSCLSENPDLKVKNIVFDVDGYSVNVNENCMISKLKTEWHLSNEGKLIVGSISRKLIVNLKDINRYNCKKGPFDCKIETCDNGYCKGDEYYVGAFGKEGPGECFCTLKNKEPFSESTHGLLSCHGVAYIDVCKKETRFKRSIPKPSCPNCNVVCHSTGINIQSLHTKITIVNACKNPSCVTKELNEYGGTVVFNDAMLVHGGETYYKFWTENSQIPIEGSITCDSFDLCQTFTNWLEINLMFQPHCWSKVKLITLLITTWSLLSMTMMMLMLVSSVFFIYKIMSPFIKFIIYLIRRNINFIIKKIKQGKMNADINLQEVRVNDLSVMKQQKGVKSKVRKLAWSTLICLNLINMAKPCLSDSYVAYTIPSHHCTFTGPNQGKCKTSFLTTITASPIGQTSTLSLETTSGESLGFIQLKLNKIDLVCTKDLLYYTGQINPQGVSVTNCDGAWECNEENCRGFGKDGSGKRSKLDEWVEDKAGFYECDWVHASLSSGCFFSSMCSWNWHKFNLSGEPFLVSRCSSWLFKVSIESLIKVNKQLVKTNLSLSPNDKKTLKPEISVSLTSVSLPLITDTNQCLIQGSNISGLIECNGRGSLVQGKIGEVQCPTLESMKNVRSSCSINRVISTVLSTSSGATFSVNQIPIGQVVQQNSLPRILDGILLHEDDDDLIASVTEIGEFSIQVEASNLEIIPEEEIIKCFVKFISLDGCYDCDSAAKLTLETKTSWGEGTGFIQCEDLNLKHALWVTENSTIQHLFINVKTPHVHSSCMFSCSGSKQKVDIVGELHYVPSVTNQSSSSTDVKHQGSFNLFDKVFLFFTEGFTFVKNLVNFLLHDWVIILIILLLVICFLIIVYFLFQLHLARNLTKKLM